TLRSLHPRIYFARSSGGPADPSATYEQCCPCNRMMMQMKRRGWSTYEQLSAPTRTGRATGLSGRREAMAILPSDVLGSIAHSSHEATRVRCSFAFLA